jgi:hypothetical protein
LDLERYKVHIDGKWSLEDLYRFPRAYEQVYFAVEAMLPQQDIASELRLIRTFNAFPWEGGYSAVNFYNSLRGATPPDWRPNVVSMKYASPGWIELLLQLPIAVQVAGAVSAISLSLYQCNKTYNAIYNDLQNRKLLRMERKRREMEFEIEEIRFLRARFDEFAGLIGLPNAEEIHKRTRDPLISLKILLSVYRRLRELARYQTEAKADLIRGIDRQADDINDLFEEMHLLKNRDE